MAQTQDLAHLEELTAIEATDKFLAYSVSGNKFGMASMSALINNGYAARRWNMNNGTPVGEAVGNIDYLRDFPGMIGLGCYLVDRNHGRRKLDPTNHYKFATGETAALDGSMGDYMWGWNTPWYYAWWVDGDYYYEAASLKPIPGKMNYRIPVASTSALGVSVVDRENLELVSVINNTARYRGGNNDSSKDSAYDSQLGKAATNLNIQTYGEYARKKGDGWEAYWYAHHAAIGILYRIIMGTRNCQEAVNNNKDANGLYQGGSGQGVTGCGGWWKNDDDHWNHYPFLSTDVAVDMADGCGEKLITITDKLGVSHNVNIPVFFGLKNFFGYLGKLERGKVVQKLAGGAYDVYILPRIYSSYSPTSTTGLQKVCTGPASNSEDHWDSIEQVSMQNLVFNPTVLGGTSNTYYSDVQRNTGAESGLRLIFVGGNAENSLTAGLAFVSVDYSPSSSDPRFGSPLCESEEDWDTTPFLAV